MVVQQLYWSSLDNAIFARKWNFVVVSYQSSSPAHLAPLAHAGTPQAGAINLMLVSVGLQITALWSVSLMVTLLLGRGPLTPGGASH